MTRSSKNIHPPLLRRAARTTTGAHHKASETSWLTRGEARTRECGLTEESSTWPICRQRSRGGSRTGGGTDEMDLCSRCHGSCCSAAAAPCPASLVHNLHTEGFLVLVLVVVDVDQDLLLTCALARGEPQADGVHLPASNLRDSTGEKGGQPERCLLDVPVPTTSAETHKHTTQPAPALRAGPSRPPPLLQSCAPSSASSTSEPCGCPGTGGDFFQGFHRRGCSRWVPRRSPP